MKDLVIKSLWQDISTAPKDGTPVDLWVQHSDGERRHTDCFWTKAEDPDGSYIGWVEPYCGEYYAVNGKATRWMPLPAGPTPSHTN